MKNQTGIRSAIEGREDWRSGHATRRRGALTAALAVLAAAVLLVVPSTETAASVSSGAGSDRLAAVDVVRYGGVDRYATSLRVARAVAADAGGSLDAVVVVSGRHWTDAVVAAPVAGALGAPVLMVPPGGLRGDVSRFLSDVGASRAVVISTDPADGDPAVSQPVLDVLSNLRLWTPPVTGRDQYSTSVAAARRLSDVGEISGAGATAIIASGEVFADALVAGPFAAHGSHPILLTPQDRLHADVAAYLSDADIDHVVIMGGAAALAPAVESSVRRLGISVHRVAGATRFETATKFAGFAERTVTGCFDGDEVGLARARIPFDSFSAAPLLARKCAPLVLTDPQTIPPVTEGFLDEARAGRDTVTLRVFGGNAAVSQTAIDDYLTASPAVGVKHYANRSERSALPASDRYFIDHNEVAALFPQCGPPPEYHPNALARMDYQQALYSGFDREITVGVFGGRPRDFVTGWWTDDKLQEVYGNTYPEISVAWARPRVTMWSFGQIGFGWRPHLQPADWMTVPAAGDRGYRGLYERIAIDGFVDHSVRGAQAFAHHYGLHTPRRVDLDDAVWIADGGQLLLDWTTFMTQFPPVDREPAAWGMRTLLEARHPVCVARQMLVVCDEPITDATSPHLRHDAHASSVGLALRNLICGEHPIA